MPTRKASLVEYVILNWGKALAIVLLYYHFAVDNLLCSVAAKHCHLINPPHRLDSLSFKLTKFIENPSLTIPEKTSKQTIISSLCRRLILKIIYIFMIKSLLLFPKKKETKIKQTTFRSFHYLFLRSHRRIIRRHRESFHISTVRHRTKNYEVDPNGSEQIIVIKRLYVEWIICVLEAINQHGAQYLFFETLCSRWWY